MSTPYTTSSDGTRIAYTAVGDATRSAILLIHGWVQQFMCGRPLLKRLQERCHLVAMDFPGHGASDKPESEAVYTDRALSRHRQGRLLPAAWRMGNTLHTGGIGHAPFLVLPDRFAEGLSNFTTTCQPRGD